MGTDTVRIQQLRKALDANEYRVPSGDLRIIAETLIDILEVLSNEPNGSCGESTESVE